MAQDLDQDEAEGTEEDDEDSEDQLAVIDVSMAHQQKIRDKRLAKQKTQRSPEAQKAKMNLAIDKFVRSLHEQHQTLLIYRKFEEEEIDAMKKLAEKECERLMSSFKKSFTKRLKDAVAQKKSLDDTVSDIEKLSQADVEEEEEDEFER